MPVDIPLCIPAIQGNEWKYLKECLDTGWVSSAGSFVNRFERAIEDYLGAGHAVATVNGTAALHMALLVAGVSPDDEVLVSDLTFIAPVNAIRYVGAWPVLIDAEPRYWQIDPEKVLDFLKKECVWRSGALYNRTSDRRVRALLPVHILGHPVEMGPILDVAEEFGLVVIEDATEGFGASYQGRKLGDLADISCLSFNGNKLITTGGGGMVVTSNTDWAEKVRYLTSQAKDDPVESVHGELGYNYRLTNIQAALGCAQLESIDQYVGKKREIARTYSEELSDVVGITFLKEAEGVFSTFWMATALIDENHYGMDSRDLMLKLQAAGIQTRPLWQPMHLSPAHSEAIAYRCEVSESLNRRSLSLPCSVGLTSEQQSRVIKAVMQHAA
jgi:perosamine synthetase